MDITDWLKPWSDILLYTNFFLMFGVLALFVEAAFIVRALVFARQAPVRYILPFFPLSASILFYFFAMHGWQVYSSFTTYGPLTLGKLDPNLWTNWPQIQADCVYAAVFNLALLAAEVVAFALILLVERRLMPRINRPPALTVVRGQRFF